MPRGHRLAFPLIKYEKRSLWRLVELFTKGNIKKKLKS